MLVRALTILISISYLISCKPDTNNRNTSLNKPNITSGHHTFIVFEKEQKLEHWFECDAIVFQDSLSFDSARHLPPGIYTSLEKNNGLSLQVLHPQFKKKYSQIGIEEIRIGSANDSLSNIVVSHEALQQLKTGKRSTAIILPNDFRKSGQPDPCFACPHWMAEIYAQLELSLEPYQ